MYDIAPAEGCVERVDLLATAPFEIEIVPEQQSFHVDETAKFLIKVRLSGRPAAKARFSFSAGTDERIYSRDVTPDDSADRLTDDQGEAQIAVPLTAGPAKYRIGVRVKETPEASETSTDITIRASRPFYNNPYVIWPAVLLGLFALVGYRMKRPLKTPAIDALDLRPAARESPPVDPPAAA